MDDILRKKIGVRAPAGRGGEKGMNEVKETLKKQLELLSERSKGSAHKVLSVTELVNLSHSMGQIADALVTVIILAEREEKKKAEETARANRESAIFTNFDISDFCFRMPESEREIIPKPGRNVKISVDGGSLSDISKAIDAFERFTSGFNSI
jgi:hypothetical protein